MPRRLIALLASIIPVLAVDLQVGNTTYTFNSTASLSLGIPFTVYWNILPSSVQFGIKATPQRQGWVGFGFGTRMVGSKAVVGTRLTSGDVAVNEFSLASQDTSGVQVAASPVTSGRAVDYAADGSMSFVFTIPRSNLGSNQNGFTSVIAASGAAPDSLTTLREHTVYVASSITLSSSGNGTVINNTSSTSSNFIITHLVLMMVGWLALFPLAVVLGTPRFRSQWFKWDTKYPPRHTLVHRIVAIVAIAVIIAGFTTVKKSRYATVDRSYRETHETLGTVAFVLVFAQAALGLLRVAMAMVPSLAKSLDNAKVGKAVVTMIHRWFGYIVWVLAVVAMFFGLLTYPDFGSGTWSIVILFIALAAVVLFLPPVYSFTKQTCSDEPQGEEAQFTQ